MSQGDVLTKLFDALKAAQHQVRVAQAVTSSWRVEEILAEIEDDIGADLARIRDAVDLDAAEAEANGETERVRRAWFPQAA